MNLRIQKDDLWEIIANRDRKNLNISVNLSAGFYFSGLKDGNALQCIFLSEKSRYWPICKYDPIYKGKKSIFVYVHICINS